MDHQGVKLHETNEGRETQQGIAGFEGANALWFMLAFGLAITAVLGRMLAQHPPVASASLPTTRPAVRRNAPTARID